MAVRRGVRVVTTAAGLAMGLATVGGVPAFAAGDGSAAVTAAPLVGSPHGLWNFDETSGSVAADSSGNDNDGNIRGGVVKGVPGYTGTAFGFGANGSWVQVPNDASLNPGTRDFSFSARVKLDSLPQNDDDTFDVFRKGVAGTKGGEFKIEISDGGKVRCIAKDGNRVRGAIAGTSQMHLRTGQWYLVGCEHTASKWSVVVNDTKRSKTVNFGSISNSLAVSIGSNYGEEDFVDGTIDEVRFNVV
jgi:Concanavalin A-like lectin/glucanases superfamily